MTGVTFRATSQSLQELPVSRLAQRMLMNLKAIYLQESNFTEGGARDRTPAATSPQRPARTPRFGCRITSRRAAGQGARSSRGLFESFSRWRRRGSGAPGRSAKARGQIASKLMDKPTIKERVPLAALPPVLNINRQAARGALWETCKAMATCCDRYLATSQDRLRVGIVAVEDSSGCHTCSARRPSACGPSAVQRSRGCPTLVSRRRRAF